MLKIPDYKMTSVRYGSGQPASPGPRRAMPRSSLPDRVDKNDQKNYFNDLKAGVSDPGWKAHNVGRKPS
jgi:hypothetical protein